MKEEELAWRRTQFLLERSEKFDGDVELQKAVRTLVYPELDPQTGDTKLAGILRKASSVGLPFPPHFFTEQEVSQLESLNRLFAFFTDLYYCYKRGVLTKEELRHYGWVGFHIYKSEVAKTYCNGSGFKAVLKLCHLLAPASDGKKQ